MSAPNLENAKCTGQDKLGLRSFPGTETDLVLLFVRIPPEVIYTLRPCLFVHLTFCILSFVTFKDNLPS